MSRSASPPAGPSWCGKDPRVVSLRVSRHGPTPLPATREGASEHSLTARCVRCLCPLSPWTAAGPQPVADGGAGGGHAHHGPLWRREDVAAQGGGRWGARGGNPSSRKHCPLWLAQAALCVRRKLSNHKPVGGLFRLIIAMCFARAGLWEAGSGVVNRISGGPQSVFFVPQKPYLARMSSHSRPLHRALVLALVRSQTPREPPPPRRSENELA